MFRAVLLVVGVILLFAGAAAWIAGCFQGIPITVFGVLLTGSLLFERHIYKPIQMEAPGMGWEKMAEQFVDPKSGQHVVVYFNPRTGKRRYVSETGGR